MSIDFTVVCRRPRPPGWEGELAVDGLPFAVWLDDVASWREGVREMLDPENHPGELEAELGRRLDGPWSFVVCFNCKPAAAELVELCAEVVTEALGGFYYDDHSAEASPVAAGVERATGTAIVARWRRLAADESAQRAAIDAVAKRQYEQARRADPAGFAEADDWSDV